MADGPEAWGWQAGFGGALFWWRAGGDAHGFGEGARDDGEADAGGKGFAFPAWCRGGVGGTEPWSRAAS